MARARSPEEEQFESFVAILRGKGFFAGVAEGTPEYNARLQLARENFGKLQAQQAAPAPAPAPAPATTKAPAPEASKEAVARGEALKAEGNEALKAGDAARAAELYAEATKCDPQNAVYHSNRAAALMQLGRDEEAARECEAAIALNPAYARSYSRLGAALHKLGRYQEALDRGYNKALAIDPTNATVRENKAACERDLQAATAAASASATSAGASEAAAAAGAGAPPGMEGLAQMMQDPAFQEKAKNLAQQLGLSKEGDGSDGSGNGAPAFDMSKMSEMLSNPAIQQM